MFDLGIAMSDISRFLGSSNVAGHRLAEAGQGVILGNTVTGTSDAAQEIFDELDTIGVYLRDVFLALENDGVDKFK